MGSIAKLSKQGEARTESMPGFEGRYVEEDGYVLGFESFEQAVDFTPMYRGLPDDLCQSHHWGYVIKGQMIFHRPDGDESFEEGEAYYLGPVTPGRWVCPGPKSSSSAPATSTHRRWRSWRRTSRPRSPERRRVLLVALAEPPMFQRRRSRDLAGLLVRRDVRRGAASATPLLTSNQAFVARVGFEPATSGL